MKVVHVLSPGPLDVDYYPFRCAVGLIGSSDPAEQTSSLCAGRTSAGTYQPIEGGTSAAVRNCTMGSFCPLGANVPLPCEAGTYSSATDLTRAEECTKAQPGFYAPTGSSAPIACAAGTIAPAEGLSECSKCEPGTFSSITGGTSCEPCPRGYLCVEGASAPQPCPAGSYANLMVPTGFLRNLDDCIICPAGTSCSVGSMEPVRCSPGTFNALPGQETCLHCPAGKYQDQDGATRCLTCPLGSYCPGGTSNPLGCESGAGFPNAVTDIEGSTSPADCKCKEDYYDTSAESNLTACSVCPAGTDCSVGSTLTSLPIKRGYYRLHASSINVQRCPDAGVNCTDAPECKESTSGCRGTVQHQQGNSSQAAGRRLQAHSSVPNSTLGCHDDLHGVYCRLCSQRDDGKSVYYSGATTSSHPRCRLCRETARDAIIAFFGLLALAAFVIFSLFSFHHICLSEPRKVQLRRAWETSTQLALEP